MSFVLYIQKLMKVFHIMKRQTRSTIAAAFQLCFHFWGCFTPLQHTPEHSHTHTYIFFRDFSRHSVFWVSGLCIDSFSGNACVMSAPATGRPARWIRYTSPTTAPPPLFCWGSFIGTTEMSRAYVVWVACHCIEEAKNKIK